MIADLANTDIAGRRREYLFPLPYVVERKLLPLLNDKRDAPMLYLLCNVCSFAVPWAGLLFSLPGSHWLGAIYLTLNYVLFLQRFLLTLHFTEHRPLFKKEYGLLNSLAAYLLCPLYGVPMALYRLHHVIMHHTGANRNQADLSSTQCLQRDNLLHFFWYWARFAVAIWFELPVYALKQQHYSWAAGCVAASCGYWGLIALLWRWHPIATLWSLVIPFCLSSFLLMFGNWCQHIFIDSSNPASAYAMTYNCISCPDNQLSYNDGYHILHHLNSKYHWSELPSKFLELLDKHDQQGALSNGLARGMQQCTACYKPLALVFRGIAPFDVGLAVFTGRLGYLADRLVPCGPIEQSWSREHIIQLMQQRLRPIAAS